MTVSDTGAEVQEGIDSSNISIVLEIAPVNNAPLLRLSTHSVVVSDGSCDIGMPPIVLSQISRMWCWQELLNWMWH